MTHRNREQAPSHIRPALSLNVLFNILAALNDPPSPTRIDSFVPEKQ
jgi:hypothetical protein